MLTGAGSVAQYHLDCFQDDSMNVLAYICTWTFWVKLNALVEYLVLDFRDELVFLDFFLKGEFSPSVRPSQRGG